MASKLRRNAIITGYINSFCLVCECYFDTYEETSNHIDDKSHEGKLLAFPYLDKYGDNHIRKVNKGYFCEFCSLLFATAAKLTLHLKDKAHFENKATFLLRRPPGCSAVIAFDDLLISENAWHSLSEDTCAICNEEFANENIHKTESAHLLRLVQTKVEFGADNSIYRKTDDSLFQCLTCNSVFVLNALNVHYADAGHKTLYAQCQEEYKKFKEQNKSKHEQKPVQDVEIKAAKDKKDEVKSNKDDVKKVEVKDKNDISVKKKEEVKDKNHNIIKENTNTQKTEVNVQNSGQAQVNRTTTASASKDEASVFAKSNHLTYNAGNTNTFCRTCETKLPATLRSMKEHVNGKEHKNRLAKAEQIKQTATEKPKITKRSMERFIHYCVNIMNIFHQDVVINDKYCMSLASFHMMTKNGARFRCQSCEVTVYEEDMSEHTNCPRHERAMDVTPVITSLHDSEFVREIRFLSCERLKSQHLLRMPCTKVKHVTRKSNKRNNKIRPNIYHCGFCNLIIPRWEDVHNHLQSRDHRDNKEGCDARLQLYQPTLVERRRSDLLHLMHMQRFRF